MSDLVDPAPRCPDCGGGTIAKGTISRPIILCGNPQHREMSDYDCTAWDIATVRFEELKEWLKAHNQS